MRSITALSARCIALVVHYLVSTSASADHVGHRAAVRRQHDGKSKRMVDDTSGDVHRLKPDDAYDHSDSLAAISPQGVIIAQGFPTLDSTAMGRNSTSVGAQSSAVRKEVIAQAFPVQGLWGLPRKSRVGRVIRIHMRPHQIWSVALLAKRWWRTRHDGGRGIRKPSHIADLDDPMPQDDEEVDEKGSDLQGWSIGFIASLAALAFVVARVGGQYKVEQQPDEDLRAARGRPCWAYCCAISVVMISLLTFLCTLFILSAAGVRSNTSDDHPGYVVNDNGAFRKAGHPGERAYEAGQGVALSAAFMGFIILSRRHSQSVKVSSSLLAQIAVRGATISVLAATAAEVSGIYCLRCLTGMSAKSLLPSPDQLQLNGASACVAAAATMLLVGVSEELAKAGAVLCGTWLSAAALRSATPRWYLRPFRLLVESPRALMLAGLSAGCGFMVLENVGYLLSAGLMYDKGDSVVAERAIRCIIVAVRVGLNLHPWLTGVTCARIAKVAFAEGRDTPSLSFREFVWVLWPSVALHASFDFGLLALPGMLALFLPFVSWFVSRSVFDREWASYETRTVDADPSDEVVGRTS